MTKQEFLSALKNELSGLPKIEVDERLAFYEEMIDDRIEEGLSEEEAVADIGSVGDIATQIIDSIPLTKIAKERIKPNRRLKAWEIILLAIGSPVWIAVLAAALAIMLSVYIVFWSVIICVWTSYTSVIACGAVGIIIGAFYAASGNTPVGLFLIGSGIVLIGLSILLFFGCKYATKGMAWLTKKIAIGIKRCFVKKEAAQ